MAESEVKGSAPKGAGPLLYRDTINSCLKSTGECITRDYGHCHAQEPGGNWPHAAVLLLRLADNFRKILEPLRVTPSQAGVLLLLRRHPEAKVTNAADSLVVRVPTVCDVLNDLVRKRWVTKRYSVEDRRVVCVQLSRRG
jgi:hypothetical protein